MDKTTRRRLLAATGALSVGALAGCSGGRGDEDGQTLTATTNGTTGTATTARTTAQTPTATTDETTVEDSDDYQLQTASELRAPQDEYEDVPIPEAPGRHAYATMGDGRGPTATVFGNWKCPYTQEFVLQHLPRIIEKYVRPGDLTIRFRALSYQNGDPFLGADAPRAARAGLTVWHRDPDAFWRYFGTAFLNQPQERYEWATTEQLAEIATAAGVDETNEVALEIKDGAHADAVHETVDAAARAGVTTVPRVVVNGEVTAPTVAYEETKNALDAVVR